MSLLEKHDPNGPDKWDKHDKIAKTEKNVAELSEGIKRLYAESKESILLVLQGMDASGKDGLTREIFSQISPSWVNVHSFKKPTEEEMGHDFLWRIHKRVPKKGTVTVFNRSHYEDILVPSVYGYVDKKTIQKRFEQINNFEEMLEDNGTKVVKVYLNVGYDKQEEKLLERINIKRKHWKHADGDWTTRERWNDFMKVYEEVFDKCNKIPWHIIPCNKNWTKNYAVSEILCDVLKRMKPDYPELDSEKFTADYSWEK